MKASARIITVSIAMFLLVAPSFAKSTPKSKTTSEKIVQGTVLVATDGNLVIRKGKTDVSLMYDSASQKPPTLAAGTFVLVHYRDEKNKHVVTTVEVTDEKASDSKAQAK